ncbi:MAG: serine/threonine protein kinase [Myxococcota bacterium]
MAQDTRINIIKKLDAGGMAEVYIGKLIGAQGISRRVAVKKILPQLNKNKKFVSMFLDEARLAMNLSHANLVQTFDVTRIKDSYCIVMEFIEGSSLKAVMNFMKKKNKTLPIGTAIYIVMEAAKGLGYAHNAKDANGQPLKLIHRDVSPPNILISKEGEIKVADFGLAKAALQVETTEPGIIKGKFSYLSPEIIMGIEIDKRADIFSLGIVLFELLTGRRLFYGENDLETVKLVEKAHIPRVTALNPEVPPALERALFRALKRDRNKRYQETAEFIDDLNSVLFTYGLKVNSRDVAQIIKEVKGYSVPEKEKSGDYDFDLDSEFTGEFSFSSKEKLEEKLENPPQKETEQQEDTRSWFSDMDMDFDNIIDGENSNPSPQTETDNNEEFLSDDLLEEVLEPEEEEEEEIELEMEEENSVVSGKLDSSVMKKAVKISTKNESEEPHSENQKQPQKDSPKKKKGWFSKLFGGN